ncbi:hypothetical protein AK830_g1578 [Neonectria ditissima]|uniref:Dienelactone hydrolase domain-containing protein n=1 Tax=Neonectria ditissima TaxID=78410 RepID=A0A0P7BU32_9HYPO|nr:hypothetical protein AK830_g1578 [Neonectria ditissima]
MSCPACFQGSVHEGTPRGKDIKLHGLDAYVVEPASGTKAKGIIVVIPDAFGWEYHMFLAICGFIPFMAHNRIGKSHPAVQGFFEQLRKEEGALLPVGAAGFCWGGKHAVLLAHGAEIDARPLVDAVFAGHPSFLDLPADIDKVTRPVSIAVGDNDNQLKAQHTGAVKAILEGKPEGARGEIRVYEDATHGFCVRAALDMGDIAKKAAEAEDQCISWFNARFGIDS